jgi:hypothetical protein
MSRPVDDAAVRRTLLAVLATLLIVTLAEVAMGRHLICTCGTVKLWHGAVDSENSQQIFDWYTFTHVLHGLGFYLLLAVVTPWLPVRTRFLLAVVIEGVWEVLENSPIIIDRYRTATISLDYYGDTVINSVSDIIAMIAGFWTARTFPVWASVVVFVVVEMLLALVIRDNLTLNILMLIHPVDAIRQWQLGS